LKSYPLPLGISVSDSARRIRVDALARVEGEGALHVEVRDGRVEAIRLEIYEPPRFFEAFLRGRSTASG